jgi:putative membrane protein
MRMPESPNIGLRQADLSLSDHLAIDRTDMANQRTFLAFLRTGLAIAVLGITFLELLNTRWSAILGYVCIASGGGMVLLGALQYRRMKHRLRRFINLGL